jgi:hypothetical protein
VTRVPAGRDVSATLTVFGAAPTRATVTLASLSVPRRLARGLAMLAICWGAAIVAVFIPVAHLILVPGLAVAGLVAAVLRAREDQQILRIHGACPRCGREEDFVPDGSLRRSLAVTCPGCFNRLSVKVEESHGRPAGAQEPRRSGEDRGGEPADPPA